MNLRPKGLFSGNDTSALISGTFSSSVTSEANVVVIVARPRINQAKSDRML